MSANISIASSLPRTIIRGFRDDSGTPQTFEEEALPIHLPLIPLFTQWGPTDDAILVGGGGFSSIFGLESLDATKGFYTHQSAIAQAVMGEGNLVFIRRLLGAGAKSAKLRIGLDIVADDLPTYQRAADGTYLRAANGSLIPTTPAGVQAGHRARWVVKPIVVNVDGDSDFGSAPTSEGELVATGGTVSTFYPIFDVEARFEGSRGNNIGFRIQAPTLNSAIAADADLVDDAGAFIYRFFAVKRADALSTASIITNRQGEQYTEFSLKENVIDRKTEKAFFVDDVLLESYEAANPEEFTGYGPFKQFHVYHANVQALLDMIYALEESHGLINSAVTPEHTINLLTATTVAGVPYYTFRLETPVESSQALVFTENTNHWARDGSDGTLGNDAFDAAVASELDAFETGPIPYTDTAVYPFSCMYDSGFSIETKKKMAVILQERRDAYIVVATQAYNADLNSPSEEASLAASLRAHFRSIPESDYYGTETCRVVLMGNAGQLIGSKYKGLLPFTVAFAKKCAAYMGAANGYMQPSAAFDSAPGNIVTEYKNHNAVSKSAQARNQDWQNGLVFAQNFDRNSVFWPGLQTIYSDDTSILTSFFNMAICCNLTRIGERAWRMHTGNSKLSNEQFVDRVDTYLVEQTTGRYDDRGEITPRSYYTAGDVQRGFSWHTDITWASQGMKTVETLTIVAKRADEEAAQ